MKYIEECIATLRKRFGDEWKMLQDVSVEKAKSEARLIRARIENKPKGAENKLKASISDLERSIEECAEIMAFCLVTIDRWRKEKTKAWKRTIPAWKTAKAERKAILSLLRDKDRRGRYGNTSTGAPRHCGAKTTKDTRCINEMHYWGDAWGACPTHH